MKKGEEGGEKREDICKSLLEGAQSNSVAMAIDTLLAESI